MSRGGLRRGGVVGVSGRTAGLGEIQEGTSYLQMLCTPTRRKLKVREIATIMKAWDITYLISAATEAVGRPSLTGPLDPGRAVGRWCEGRAWYVVEVEVEGEQERAPSFLSALG